MTKWSVLYLAEIKSLISVLNAKNDIIVRYVVAEVGIKENEPHHDNDLLPCLISTALLSIKIFYSNSI